MRGGPKATSIADYLSRVPADQRRALQRLRKDIHAAVPGLEECISYQMPGFRYQGKVVVWFGAAARHCAFYPGAVVKDFKTELKGYGTSKGTIRFDADDPLPAGLVKKLLKARIARGR